MRERESEICMNEKKKETERPGMKGLMATTILSRLTSDKD